MSSWLPGGRSTPSHTQRATWMIVKRPPAPETLETVVKYNVRIIHRSGDQLFIRAPRVDRHRRRRDERVPRGLRLLIRATHELLGEGV